MIECEYDCRRTCGTKQHIVSMTQDTYRGRRPLRSIDMDVLLQPPSYVMGDANEVLPMLEAKGLLSQPVSL